MVVTSPASRLRGRRQRGTSTLEMAIWLPLLFAMLFGIGEFGLAFMQWQAIVNSAREGAREGIVFRSPCNSAQVQADVQQAVQNYAASLGVQVPPANVTITGECAGSGQPLTVRVQVPYAFPVLSALVPLLDRNASMAPTVDLIANSVMRNE